MTTPYPPQPGAPLPHGPGQEERTWAWIAHAGCFVGAWIAMAFVLIGFFLLAALGVFYLIVVILGTVRAANGQEFRYPLTLRFVS